MKNYEKQQGGEISLYAKRFENLKYDYRTSDWDEERKLKAFKWFGIFDLSEKYILDLGCGTASYTPYLGESFENVIGLDISHGNIKIAKEIDEKTEYVCGDGLNLPFKDCSLDAVFVGQVLHHFSDAKEPLKEINRILKKNGILFNIEPNDWNPMVSLKYRKRVFKKEKSSYERHHALGYIYMKKCLTSTGFLVMNKRGINFTPPRGVGIWRFIRFVESYLESSPLNLFGGSLLITARKVGDVD